MARYFGQRPSAMYGILDHEIALDFDRLCSIRLGLHDLEIDKMKAEAMKGELPIPSLFDSDQTGRFS